MIFIKELIDLKKHFFVDKTAIIFILCLINYLLVYICIYFEKYDRMKWLHNIQHIDT